MHTNASCCCTENWANSLNPSFSISSWRYTDCCWLLFQGPKLSVCSHLWNVGCCFAFQYSAPSPFTCNYFENTQMWIPDTSSTFHSFVVKIVGSLQFCCEVGGRWCWTQCVQSPEVSVTGAGTLDFPIFAHENLVVHSLVEDPPINICTETSQGIKNTPWQVCPCCEQRAVLQMSDLRRNFQQLLHQKGIFFLLIILRGSKPWCINNNSCLCNVMPQTIKTSRSNLLK